MCTLPLPYHYISFSVPFLKFSGKTDKKEASRKELLLHTGETAKQGAFTFLDFLQSGHQNTILFGVYNLRGKIHHHLVANTERAARNSTDSDPGYGTKTLCALGERV